MKLIRIERGSPAAEVLNGINREAFPEIERLEVADMFRVASEMDADIVGIYDDSRLCRGEGAGASDAADMLGFFMSEKNDECVYINYLAVDESLRGRGCGTEALGLIFDYYGELPVALDFEVADRSADNYDLRVRRRSFYLRNGFYQTGYYTVLRGVPFELVINRREFDPAMMNRLFAEISRHIAGMDERVYRMDEEDVLHG